MSNLGLSICVSEYDTENIKQALSRTENGKLDFWSLISGLFTVMPKGSIESILVYVFKTAWMKAIVLAHIQKQLASAGFHLKLNNVIVDEERELYDAFNDFELEDLSYLNVWDRHLEQSDVWGTSLNERAVEVPETVEEIVLRNIQNEKVHRAIEQLPEAQKRRIRMYFFEGMTYEEIAAKEKCKHPAVVKSVKVALESLKNILEE